MSCLTDQDCSFLHHCLDDGKCEHNSVFPLTFYTVLIYLLIPIANGLVNVTGHSMGIFKVLIVMNLLRYESIQATMITQALVIGSALPNYVSILIRKHPTKPTSLVNFNVVYILVPCSFLGSTLGVLAGQFIPILGQNILIAIVFLYFSAKFYQKYKKLSSQDKTNKISLITQNGNNSFDQIQRYQDLQKQIKTSQFQTQKANQAVNQVNFTVNLLQKKESSALESQKTQDYNILMQKQQILAYENSYHLKDALYSLIAFISFQFLVFLVQGKFSFFQFDHCSWKVYVGIGILIIITVIYLYLIRIYLNAKFLKYKQFNIDQEISLDKIKQFNLIMAGGLMGGFVQGLLGLGSGTCIMYFLLMTSINPSSAVATSGYQILFNGLSALVEGFINDEVKIIDTLFFMSICIILGGIVTFAIIYFLKNKQQKKVQRLLILLFCILCSFSIIMVIPNVLMTYFQSGWSKLLRIQFKC